MQQWRVNLIRLALVISLLALMTSQVLALTDVSLPIHPRAIPSSIVHQSRKGEGTKFFSVAFKARAPYEEVVRYYRQQAGRNVQITVNVSAKLLNTLILLHRKPEDQININISSKVGGKVTEVEITRNLFEP